MYTFTNPFFRFSLRRIVAIVSISVMIASLLPVSSAAAVLQATDNTVLATSSRVWTWFASTINLFWNRTNSQERRERRGVRPLPPVSKEEREAQVAAIELNVSGELVLTSRQRLSLSAIPLNQDRQTIHGIRSKWESSDKRVIFVRKTGEAVAGLPGKAIITARVGGKLATVRVTVVEGTKDPFGGKKRVDSTRRPQEQAHYQKSQTGSVIPPNLNLRQKRAHAVRNVAGLKGVMPFVRDPNDDPLPDNETSSLYEPNNQVGTPLGKKRAGAMTMASSLPTTENGNKNFGFALPVVNLPGRGLDASVSLFYNSLVWHKSTNPSNGSTWMTYDVDSGYPAQGFRLGYGQIEDQGSAGFTLTDSDGTRHALVFSSTNTYETTDGSFIRFVGGSGWGTLFYPDGTQVQYGAAGGGFRSYPTVITDRNGNYILISYVNGVGPRINTIQDTLGRYIRFYYDSFNDELVAITRPGLTGQPDIQVMRFYYETLTLPSGLFASGINVDKPATARAIKYIYLPASAEGTSSTSGDIGYRFDYSAYGMIHQIKRLHGMTASTNSLSAPGTVTEGINTTAATTTYGYPVSASGLSGVPTFSYRDDEWAGRASGGSAPRYQFAETEVGSETVATVTAPDLTVTETRSIKNSGAWNHGLVTEISIYYSSTVYAKTVVAWEQNSVSGTARIASIRFTNEAGRTKAKVFTYDSSTPYNNLFRVSDRDFTSDGSISSTELRKTETTYLTSSNYLNRRLLHLPSMVEVFPGGSSTPAARIDYAYDNYGSSHANLTSRNDIIMHDPAFDPFQEPQETWDWV